MYIDWGGGGEEGVQSQILLKIDQNIFSLKKLCQIHNC